MMSPTNKASSWVSFVFPKQAGKSCIRRETRNRPATPRNVSRSIEDEASPLQPPPSTPRPPCSPTIHGHEGSCDCGDAGIPTSGQTTICTFEREKNRNTAAVARDISQTRLSERGHFQTALQADRTRRSSSPGGCRVITDRDCSIITLPLHHMFHMLQLKVLAAMSNFQNPNTFVRQTRSRTRCITATIANISESSHHLLTCPQCENRSGTRRQCGTR